MASCNGLPKHFIRVHIYNTCGKNSVVEFFFQFASNWLIPLHPFSDILNFFGHLCATYIVAQSSDGFQICK